MIAFPMIRAVDFVSQPFFLGRPMPVRLDSKPDVAWEPVGELDLAPRGASMRSTGNRPLPDPRNSAILERDEAQSFTF